MDQVAFADVPERQRFELRERGVPAFANYRREDDPLVIPHAESPPPLRSKGTANRLIRAIASYARERQLTIVPLCRYARAWFRRHPDYADILT